MTTVNNLNVNTQQGITIILGCFPDHYISIPKLFRDYLLSNYLKGLRVTEPSSNVKSDPCTIFHPFGLSVQWSWLQSKCPRLIPGLGLWRIHEVQTVITRVCKLTLYNHSSHNKEIGEWHNLRKIQLESAKSVTKKKLWMEWWNDWRLEHGADISSVAAAAAKAPKALSGVFAYNLQYI